MLHEMVWVGTPEEIKKYIEEGYYVIGFYEANKEIAAYLRKNCRKSDIHAYTYAGYLYDIQGKYRKAFRIAKRLLKAGSPFGYHMMGVFYTFGRVVKQNLKTAIPYFLTAADMGIASAYCQLGRMYLKYEGYNKKTGFRYMEKAAELGNSFAQFKVAVHCMDDDVVDGDVKKAVDYFIKAADHGVSAAIERVYEFYENGDFVKQDKDKAVSYLKAGARLRNSFCRRTLGMKYIRGINIEQDVEEGIHLLRLAAIRDDVESCELLAALYEGREGCKKDDKESFKYAKQAADLGSFTICKKLGLCYLEGKGTRKDIKKARAYIAKGVLTFDEECEKLLKELEERK